MFAGHDLCMTKPATVRDPALVEFGQKVREARERAGKRLMEFAAELGVSRHTLQNIESGRAPTSNVVYWRVANALELDPTPVLRDAS